LSSIALQASDGTIFGFEAEPVPEFFAERGTKSGDRPSRRQKSGNMESPE
jgi:hypothetical protein